VNVTFSWSAPIESARDATVVVREALLPMLLWPSVPVVREVEQKLTVIDRFVVEAALQMAPVTAVDIAEVTGVPQDAVSRIAGRLVGLGLLVPDGIGFAPTESATAALNRASVPERQVTRLAFLYLPQGDDLIAYQDGPHRVDPPMLHRMVPETMAPLHPGTAERRLAGFLRDRIVGGQVVGLPEGIVDVDEEQVDEKQTVPLGCPAYRCAGSVVTTNTNVELRLHTVGAKRKQINYKIAGAAGQAASWSSRAEWTDAAVADWTATGGTVETTQLGPTQWSLTVDGPAAVAAAAEVDLSRSAGLSMQSDDCVTYLDVSFAPADHSARRVFAMQDALLRITSKVTDDLDEEAVADAASSARARYGLTEADLTDAAVHDQLWVNGHYLHVYALRKDFVHYV
jgi:hypothetical protein